MFEESNPTSYITSYLSQDAIRWINRKQSNNSNSLKAYLFPPLALQIHKMRPSVESEFVGNRKVAELFEAVKYVVEFYNLDDKKLAPKDDKNTEEEFLNGYVGSDRSGGIEFAEYLAINYDRSFANAEVSEDVFEGDVQELSMRTARLHAAFEDLCNFVRRRRINTKIAESAFSDIEKYNSMVELFGINYFKTDSFEKQVSKQNLERSRRNPNMVVEKTGMRNYREENSIELRRQRRIEVRRVTTAAMHLSHQREERLDPKSNEKLLKFWEDKGEILPLPKPH